MKTNTSRSQSTPVFDVNKVMLVNTPPIYCAGIFDMKTYAHPKPDLSSNFQIFKLLLAEKDTDINVVRPCVLQIQIVSWTSHINDCKTDTALYELNKNSIDDNNDDYTKDDRTIKIRVETSAGVVHKERLPIY